MKQAIILIDRGKGLEAATPVLSYSEARGKFRDMAKGAVNAELWTSSGRVKRIRHKEVRELGNPEPIAEGYPAKEDPNGPALSKKPEPKKADPAPKESKPNTEAKADKKPEPKKVGPDNSKSPKK